MKTIVVLTIFVTTSTYGNPVSMDKRTFTEEGENIFYAMQGTMTGKEYNETNLQQFHKVPMG